LAEIKNTEAEMDNTAQWNAQELNTRTERTQSHERSERYVRSLCQLANETVHMIVYLTEIKQITEAFMLPEMVDRVTAMLNYFLVELTGSRCGQLKVKNSAKYFFNPRQLLLEIIDIYLHFSVHSIFCEAVARDGRSYHHTDFQRAAKLLSDWNDRTPAQVKQFEDFLNKVKKAAETDQDQDQLLGDIPDEFLDPLTCNLMEDPVILPTSGHSVDRAVIARHLLSDPRDPFNRAPLSIDMVKPNTELKKQIDDFKNKKKKSKE